jgi:hypothetical protein
MPPRGVKKGTKRARQYEHVKQSEKRRGVSTGRAEEIAARTVNKQRAQSGEARSSSRSSRSSSGSSSGGRTRDQLYAEARRRNIKGRSKMNKAQLQRAVDNKKR